MELSWEWVRGFGIFIGYFLVLAMIAFIVRLLWKVPKEVFRKILHLICVGSIFILLYAFEKWYLAAFSALLFGLLVYPVLYVAERLPRYSHFLVERDAGEIKRSLLIVFSMMAAMIAFFWGWLGEGWKYIVLLAILAWGLGDATAALVGTYFGRQPIQRFGVNGKKTREGTLAMMGISFLVITAIGFILVPAYYPRYLIVAGVGAMVGGMVELVTRGGWDTLTVPFAVAFALYLTTLLLIGGG